MRNTASVEACVSQMVLSLQSNYTISKTTQATQKTLPNTVKQINFRERLTLTNSTPTHIAREKN